VRRAAPYRHVLCHGWTLDELGRPMSKSLGNITLPNDICNQWGADLLRLWVCSQDFTADMRMNDRVMTQLAEAYRKIRNTFRFVLGNLDGFNPQRDALPGGEMWEMDRWMLERTAGLIRDCRAWYQGFEFHRVYHAVHDFCVVELSAFYFDVLKDRLYTFGTRSVGRRSAQTAIWKIASALVRLLAPLTVFTSEEIWKYLPRGAEDPESVHMALFPADQELETGLDPQAKLAWEKLLLVRNEVLQALEPPRKSKFISSALEAKVTLSAQGDLATLLAHYASQLPALFIVSQVALTQKTATDAYVSQAIEGLGVKVERAEGAKCERCWNYSLHVGASAVYPTLCERCVPTVEEILSVNSR